MALTITTPAGVQHIPPQASAGPTVPDPTGAPDGQVVTTASGALVLATPSGGTDLAWQALPDTGWTAATWEASASITAGVATITVTGSSNGFGGRLRRSPFGDAVPMGLPEAPRFELRARIIETATPGNDHANGIVWTGGAFGAERGYRVMLTPNDVFMQRATSAGSWSTQGFAGGSLSATNGTTWLSLVVTPLGVIGRYGTGAGTAPPTTWSTITTVAADAALYLGGVMGEVGVFSLRTAHNGDPYTCTFDGIAVRSLLGPAP